MEALQAPLSSAGNAHGHGQGQHPYHVARPLQADQQSD